ncbi:NAD(P)H-hydrate epimerase [Paenarthrobacter aurescens]|uniref:Bifunctional NAD(P)H-hydrate repair enzyme n=1 Tax=Paenarthrobacter aurescens TaxID=43663 RepID=A0A4Y3N9T8_PAEAU|nr:NAD(P)H-hydrate epimerase [Paenarthrobacter aurescens]MDO6144306.1 NAD(P)H-hydrate epimerase [Paenarthrobacter aurescens]MDO6148153.1 NAD(P)H-hydrate epimerase [Paenarthrobacter aurescens]MDO6159397.1 NAD(P)H-hydrate epimerase [Paenarthrobacter aurescens]MDO6163380.1 NAD(P)H-hydrate epimerase [Paenarthrobacter aurescens]GEB17867.1 bifunctional NAD(P)H-hydrate repair enzyme [Paenarthrobacter aurescens]
MISAFTGQQIRDAEQPLLDSGEGAVLMHRAAYGLAQVVAREVKSRRKLAGASVTVLAGKGNNGGDGLFAAAFLARRGMRTMAILTAGEAHPEGLAAFVAAGGRQLSLEAANVEELAVLCAGDDVIIDALLGTGARGGLRGASAELAAALQELHPRLVVACDLPSGLDANTGVVHWPVLDADVTVTFGGVKAGLMADPGEGCAGRVELVRIGIEDALEHCRPEIRRLASSDIGALLPDPGRRAHKYSRGVLGVVAGSPRFAGAAVLGVHAAALAGAGMVRYVGPREAAQLVLARTPEALWETDHPGRVQAWLLGSGVDGEEQLERARNAGASALAHELPVVVDAGALSLLPQRCPAHWILTPHAGELATLLTSLPSAGEVEVTRDDVESRPLHYVRQAAELTGATVLLKGATTLVSSPSGVVFSQSDGTAWMATAGSGDVLAGVLGALLAQSTELVRHDDGAYAALGLDPADRWAALAAVAASVHGRAGTLASADFEGGPLTASAIMRAVPRVIGSLNAEYDRTRP